MNEPAGGPSPGEWAGMVTAIGLVAGATFKGIERIGRWMSGWAERRAKRRDEKLAAWHDELVTERAALASDRAALHEEYRADMSALKREVGHLRRENSALRTAFELMAGPVRATAPDDPRLRQADQILAQAFRLDPLAPVDFAGPISALGGIEGTHRAPRLATDEKEV